MTRLVVTVDGPSGSGKSTVSRAVAERTGLPHLDTGAFYRVATLAALRAGVDLDDGSSVGDVAAAMRIDYEDGQMSLEGEDVSEEIRGEEVTANVSLVSSHPVVREIFVQAQRDWVEKHRSRAVVEGRDVGSVVFPEATMKIYLDARPEVRAKRRALQTGEEAGSVLRDIARRDHHDSTREVSPLTIPQGAVIVDTSDLTFEEVVERLVELVLAES